MPYDSRIRGAAYGLGAAFTFGLSPPLSKLLLGSMAPLALAGLLYLGGALVLTPFWWTRRTVEAPLRGGDWLSIGSITLIGGAVAPALMLSGLARLSGLSGSLLLNLEAPFTMLIAVMVFREHLEQRSLIGAGLVVIGSVALAYQAGRFEGSLLSALLVAAACLGWAIDNNLTQRLSLKNPLDIARLKTLGAGLTVTSLAAFRGEVPMNATIVGSALALGGISYGLSIVLDTLALRHLGAAREAAFFASAPFVGAVLSIVLLGEQILWPHAVGMASMLAGVVLLLRAKHSHDHVHEPLEHEHVHIHDEHHEHQHDGPATEPHSHTHKHDAIKHAHPHASDAHHRHKH